MKELGKGRERVAWADSKGKKRRGELKMGEGYVVKKRKNEWKLQKEKKNVDRNL